MYFKTSKCYFSTLTVNKWASIFDDFPESVNVLYNSFEYMTNQEWLNIHAFVIMRDHIHLLWTINSDYEIETLVTKFKAYTGREIIRNLKRKDFEYYQENFLSVRKDRESKFWKLNSNNLKIDHLDIFRQKLNYIHSNPTKGLYQTCNKPEEYHHSSAKSYLHVLSLFNFLTIYTPET